MPTIAESAQQLAAHGLPILFIDTCVLLDIIRTPLRKIPGCIQNAVGLVEMQAKSSCRVVASSMIQNEWKEHEQSVVDELDRHFGLRDQDSLAFHEACGLVGIPLSFSQASYQSAGLGAKLRDLSDELMSKALHLSPSDETRARATTRTLAYVRPARKGGGLQDCIIIEEYLELCRSLQAVGFTNKKVFCSSNTQDYQNGPKLHEDLDVEFQSVGLTFTNALHWAVNELQKP